MTQMLSAATATQALAYVTDPTLRALVPAALAAGTAGPEHAVTVCLNHGRWVVECPTCRSGYGAQLACETDPRYMCHDCLNAALDGLWRPVVWPGDAPAVEADLAGVSVEECNWPSPPPPASAEPGPSLEIPAQPEPGEVVA